MRRSYLSRRDWLRCTAASLGVTATGWFAPLAEALSAGTTRRRHCILLWMAGGPSQMDTFDLKPGHENGGEFKEISTSVAGLRFSEHLPTMAKHADQLAVVRSLSTKEGDHNRGAYLMRTGQRPGSPVKYPTIGSSISKALGDELAPLPNYVAVNANLGILAESLSPGFLGPKYAPATVVGMDGQAADDGEPGFAQLRVDNLTLPEGVSPKRAARRQELWDAFQQDFLATRPVAAVQAHDTVYRRAVRTMSSKESEAFDLTQEADEVREAYGRGRFGQGCLVARRLVERGVPFVEVTLDGAGGLGWDTHQNNFELVKNLSGELDAGWGALMTELKERDLLQDTTILWMGEFGRTPKINEQGGRDHFPNAWSCVFAGGGINGGQAYGKTDPSGMEVADGKVDVGDVLATLCSALGMDPETENISQLGRPIKIAEGHPISDILA